jgi:hypothetical protein
MSAITPHLVEPAAEPQGRLQCELTRTLRARLLKDRVLVFVGHTVSMALIGVLAWDHAPAGDSRGGCSAFL